MKSSTRQFPMARKEGLLVEELPDEVLVYDLDRKKAHCLNQTAALIWQHCDGRRSVSEIAGALTQHLNIPIDEEVVWYGLKNLGKSRLLEGEVVQPGVLQNATRRDLIRKIGLAVSVPLVISVLAPSASADNSCVGRVCHFTSECGVCACNAVPPNAGMCV